MSTKPPVTPPTVAEANAALASLREQMTTLESRRAEIAKERERLAASALIDRSARASRKLDDLSKEAVSITVDLENMSAAIRSAEARVKAATERQAQAQEVQNAQQARIIMQNRVAAAARAEAALAEYANAMEALVLAGRDLRRITDKAPSSAWESLAWESANANCRFGFFERGLLPSSVPARLEMRAPLPELISRIDKLARNYVEGLLGAEEQRSEAA